MSLMDNISDEIFVQWGYNIIDILCKYMALDSINAIFVIHQVHMS